MSAGLALLCARRAARPGVAVLVAVAATLPLLDGGAGRLESLPPVLQGTDTGAASTGWIAALVVATAWASMSGARVLQRWYDGEAAWLAPSRPPRLALAASGVLGASLGAAALVLVAALSIGAFSTATEDTLLELEGVGGPERSLVLMPGESFERSLPAGPAGVERRARVRLMPTVGGDGPTTTVRIDVLSNGGAVSATTTSPLVSRRWGEVPLGAGDSGSARIVVTNAGSGALAVLGPRPVEVWRASHALADGHLRAAGLGALWVAAIAALAVAAGAWVTPAIAGLLAAAAALFAVAGGSVNVPLLSPLAEALGHGLSAVDEGRAPTAPRVEAWLHAAAVLLLATCAVRPALARWRREGRR